MSSKPGTARPNSDSASGPTYHIAHTMWETQAIYFMRPQWTPATSEAWLRKHNYRAIKPMHAVGHEMRYRIHDPRRYQRFTTVVLPNNVHFVRGELI